VTTAEIRKAARALFDAERSARQIDMVSASWPDMTPYDAYEVQKELIRLRLEDGEREVGMKIGLTSRAMQRQFGITEPDFGHLTDAMLLFEGAPCPMEGLIAPRVEGELAFLLKRELKGPGVTVADVYSATEYVTPSFEIIDSRIRDWKIKYEDTIADNGSSARFAVGGRIAPLSSVDMRLTGMTLEKNGELVASGTTAEVWGNPAASVAWLANAVAEHGVSLKAGSIVLSGAVTSALPAAAGDVFTVSFCGLGSLTLRFE